MRICSIHTCLPCDTYIHQEFLPASRCASRLGARQQPALARGRTEALGAALESGDAELSLGLCLQTRALHERALKVKNFSHVRML